MRIYVGDLSFEDCNVFRILDLDFRTFDVEAFGFRIVEFSHFDFGLQISGFRFFWRRILNAVPDFDSCSME